MRKIFLTLTVSLLISACGGGGDSSDNSTPQTANPQTNTPATPSSNAVEQLKGDWISNCQSAPDGTSGFITYTFDTLDDGSEAFFNGVATYDTSNCSGVSNVVVIAGPVTYQGKHTTSICISEKIDQELTLATNGDNTLDGVEFQQFLTANQLPDTIYDIACQYNNQLLLGLQTETYDAYSNAKRPIEMNVSIPLDVWVDGPSARNAKESKMSLSENMKLISQRINKVSE